jgi:hypothetical protein
MAALAAIMAIQIQDLEKANVEARRRKVRTNKFLLFEDRLSINKTDVSGSQDYVNPSLSYFRLKLKMLVKEARLYQVKGSVGFTEKRGTQKELA